MPCQGALAVMDEEVLNVALQALHISGVAANRSLGEEMDCTRH